MSIGSVPVPWGEAAATPFLHYCKAWTPRPNVDLVTNWWPDWATFKANAQTHEDFHLRNSSLSGGERFRVESCVQDDFWYSERAGPMVGTGGHDFWIMSWRSGIFEAFGVGGGSLAIQQVELGPTDPSGHLLPYPPIHLHHTHWMQDLSDSTRLDLDQSNKHVYAECIMTGINCFTINDGSAMINAHGDWQRLDGPDYTHFALDFRGQEMVMSHRLSFLYMLDDVRPPGSAPLTFHAFSAIHVLPPGTAPARPGSRLTADNWWDVNGINSVEYHDGINVIARVETLWYGESWSYFSFKMPFSGELIERHTSLHSHMDSFHMSLMVRGLPAEYLPAHVAALRPIGTDCVIYKNADVVQARLEALAKEWDTDERLMCEMHSHYSRGVGFDMMKMVTMEDFQYDREVRKRCRSGFRFHAGETMTAIATHGQVGDEPENTIIHTNWNLVYWADDNMTHTTTTAGAFSDPALPYYGTPELTKFALFLRGHGVGSGLVFENPSWLRAPGYVLYGPTLAAVLVCLLLLERPTRRQRLGVMLLALSASILATISLFSWKVPLVSYVMRDRRSAELLMAKDNATKAKHFAMRAAVFAFGATVGCVGYALFKRDGSADGTGSGKTSPASVVPTASPHVKPPRTELV